MKAVDNSVAAAKDDIGSERSALFPQFSVSAGAGASSYDRDVPLGGDGTWHPKELSIGVNQLVWDFGLTRNNITRAEKNLSKEESERLVQSSNLMLAGIEAYLKLVKAQRLLHFAEQSEANIKQQTQMENARLEAGRGYTTDLLQAKSQLSAAKARRVAAEGLIETSVNRYKTVFGNAYVPNGTLANLREPVDALPKTLEEVIAQLESSNPDVLAAKARSALVGAVRDAVRSKEWMPRIDVQLSHTLRNDVDGVNGNNRNDKVMLQAQWNYDLGQKASLRTSAATYQAASEQEKAIYVVNQAQEEASSAWSDLQTSHKRQEYLGEQVEISRKFLDLARKERELGRRPLLDVLNGETGLINAQGDLAAAEADVVLAAFRVLRAAGKLDLAVVQYLQ